MPRRSGLEPQEMQLLREVIAKQQPALLPLLNLVGTVPLTLEQRENLREAVSDEFVELGLHDDDEPNPYGLQLDSLIGHLGNV